MINELYQLTKAMEQANIVAEHTHPKYKPIPKVTKTVSYTHLCMVSYRYNSFQVDMVDFCLVT